MQFLDRLKIELEETADWNKTVTVNRKDLEDLISSFDKAGKAELISSLKKNDKIGVVQDDSTFFEGYVESKSVEYLTIIESGTGLHRVFRIDDIEEIERV